MQDFTLMGARFAGHDHGRNLGTYLQQLLPGLAMCSIQLSLTDGVLASVGCLLRTDPARDVVQVLGVHQTGNAVSTSARVAEARWGDVMYWLDHCNASRFVALPLLQTPLDDGGPTDTGLVIGVLTVGLKRCWDPPEEKADRLYSCLSTLAASCVPYLLRDGIPKVIRIAQDLQLLRHNPRFQYYPGHGLCITTMSPAGGSCQVPLDILQVYNHHLSNQQSQRASSSDAPLVMDSNTHRDSVQRSVIPEDSDVHHMGTSTAASSSTVGATTQPSYYNLESDPWTLEQKDERLEEEFVISVHGQTLQVRRIINPVIGVVMFHRLAAAAPFYLIQRRDPVSLTLFVVAALCFIAACGSDFMPARMAWRRDRVIAVAYVAFHGMMVPGAVYVVLADPDVTTRQWVQSVPLLVVLNTLPLVHHIMRFVTALRLQPVCWFLSLPALHAALKTLERLQVKQQIVEYALAAGKEDHASAVRRLLNYVVLVVNGGLAAVHQPASGQLSASHDAAVHVGTRGQQHSNGSGAIPIPLADGIIWYVGSFFVFVVIPLMLVRRREKRARAMFVRQLQAQQ